MEKRKGYKQTPLGWIPEEWEVVKLKDIADKNDKYSFTGGPFGSDLKSIHYTEKGVRVVQLQNIGDGEFLDDYCIYTSNEKADELISCNIYPNDIIIAKMAEPLARACKIPNFQKRYLMCSDGIRLKINKDNYCSDYILYSINSKYFRKNAEMRATGTTRLRIGLSVLRDLEIVSPPFPEQKKIAAILSTVDEKIESIETGIDAAQQLKKGLMQQLLNRGIGHTEFKETKIGTIPKKWNFGNLTDIASITMGQSPPGETYNCEEIGVPMLNGPTEFTNKYPSSVQYTSKPTKMSKAGDVLFCVRGSSTGRMNISDKEYCIGRGLAAIRQKVNSNTLFIYYTLLFITQRIFFEAKGAGSTFPNISGKDLGTKLISIPSLFEQKKIASILSTVDEKLDILKEKKEAYQDLKKGLMQQLLTGNLRVSVDFTENEH